MNLPALSVKQPWASRIARGAKTIETRTWAPSWRGPLVIVSSREPDTRFEDSVTSGLPYGQALCIVLLIDCRPMTEADEPAACCEIYPRAVAWVLKYCWRLVPFGVTGQRGLYPVEIHPAHVGGRGAYDEIAEYHRRAIARGFRWRKGHDG